MAADCTPGPGSARWQRSCARGPPARAQQARPIRRSRNTPPMRTFTIKPRGPFDLGTAREFAGGFAAGIGSRAAIDGSILMTFPVEGWSASAVVQLRQETDGSIQGDAFGAADIETIERQAARSLSLDHDGVAWPDIGTRDPVIGRLQRGHGLLRPVCFFSAYETATSFVIGQRI